MMTQILHYRADRDGRPARARRRLAAAVLHLAGMLVALQRLSRERAQLAEMDEATLTDIGLTRAEMLAELRKPFRRR